MYPHPSQRIRRSTTNVTISGYAVVSNEPNTIVLGISKALAACSRPVSSVTVYGYDISVPATMIDYIPLQDICRAHRIPYYRTGEDADKWDMEMRIIF